MIVKRFNYGNTNGNLYYHQTMTLCLVPRVPSACLRCIVYFSEVYILHLNCAVHKVL